MHTIENTIFLLANDMQFGYLNGIIYQFIYSLVRIPNFKCSLLQMQNEAPSGGKNYENSM